MAVVDGERSLIETLRLLRRVRRQLAVVHLTGDAGDQQLAIVSVEQVVRALLREPEDAAQSNRPMNRARDTPDGAA